MLFIRLLFFYLSFYHKSITPPVKKMEKIQICMQKKIQNTPNLFLTSPSEITIVNTLVHNLPEFFYTYFVYMNSFCNTIFIICLFFS